MLHGMLRYTCYMDSEFLDRGGGGMFQQLDDRCTFSEFGINVTNQVETNWLKVKKKKKK